MINGIASHMPDEQPNPPQPSGEMTDEMMRVKIALHLGWSTSPNMGTFGGYIARTPAGENLYYATAPTRELAITNNCPNYLNDLNAMAEAEKVMTQEQRFQYGNQIMSYVESLGGDGMDWGFASARQRATAFCATLKL